MLEFPCPAFDIKGHSYVGTAIGYHLGIGNKPKCTLNGGLMVIEPSEFNGEDYIESVRNHRKRKLQAVAARNELLRTSNLYELLRTGELRATELVTA